MSTALSPRLVIEGSGGLLDGEVRALERGDTLVVGRSRSCEISLRRARSFTRSRGQARILRSRPFRRVSRVHCEIAYLPDGRAEIRDLSSNGTLVDGRRLERAFVIAPGDPPVDVVLADARHGALRIEFRPGDSAAG